ncbi:VOC family protein [Tenggerimyces flavus]|uniref:VOC family protein n=1 Tax=Tenggerimyces flavus TaxID=1708749 RepID=A0ABV7YJW4_9ACTN|nr:VOC family protein [Tenggerimyces flavus]MBM7787628.1 hypothetical protein [Tenggerimyces flavus]
MDPLLDRARVVVEALERGDVETVYASLTAGAADWDWDAAAWIASRWRPGLDEHAGLDRAVVEVRRVSDVMVRAVFSGSVGTAFATVLFDEVGMVTGLNVSADEQDGGYGISIACERSQVESLSAFYSRLVDAPLGFGEGLARPPRWPDPAYPQQIHLDVLVSDLSAAEAEVLSLGATKLHDSGEFRVFADPVGHPFCLYPGAIADTDRLGILARVVIDCPDPAVLATFWGGLLDLPRRVLDTPGRVVVAREDESLPMIALQRVENYQPPGWPDPNRPAQLHFDIGFDDRPTKERLALSLGATQLPPQGGSCPVYADPAGHPFCLCYTGE